MIARTLRSALTIQEKTATGKLLELWLEVGSPCHLNCNYCFNNNGGSNQTAVGQLSISEYFDILNQFKNLGGVSVGIPGNGEPFHSQNIMTTMAIVREASRLGLRVNIFTAGDLLAENVAQELKALGVSLSVKFNSFNLTTQDDLVGSCGYTERRWRKLEMLFRLGFNKTDDTGVSGLAFVNSIMPDTNDQEILNIYRYCRDNGIVPDIDTFLPFGRASYLMSEDTTTIDRVTKELQRFDAALGICWQLDSVPTYIGANCDRCFYHLYVDFQGSISPCLGANKKGVFVGNVRTGLLAVAWRSPLMHNIRARRYLGKCSECVKFRDGRCNSCLGRFTRQVSLKGIETIGCWRFVKE